MNIVDSSGWLEYFADDKNADFFAPAIEHSAELIVPVITVYEVFKRILQQRDENDALQVVAVMMQSEIIDIDTNLALLAAKLSDRLKLPMADSLILATARTYQATLWTQDADFKDLPNVRYIQK